MVDDASNSQELYKDQLRLLVESLVDYAVFVLDPQGVVRTWNPGAERAKGYRAEEIIGQHFSKFYPPEEAGKCDAQLEVAAREGRFEAEGWRVRKDGTRFWANVVITAMRDADGKLVGYAKVTRDLTDRVRAEQQRIRVAQIEEANRVQAESLGREREARAAAEQARTTLLTTLRSIGDGVIATDELGRVTLMNPIAEKLTGYSEKESYGRPLPEIFPIANEYTREPVENPVTLVLREGRVVGMANHTILLQRDGRELPISDSGAPIRDHEGVIRGVVLVFRDATDERIRDRRRDLLAEITESLFSSLSPFSGIVDWVKTLDEKADESTRRRAFEAIQRNASEMTRVIAEMLDASRVISGRAKLETATVDLRDIIDQALDFLRTAIDTKRLHVERAVRGRSCRVKGDKARLKHVVLNILSNAVKFTALDGRITVRLSQSNNHCEITIADTGVGISAQRLRHIFEPIRDSSPERAREVREAGGLGVRLAISRYLVEMHGGTLTAMSEGLGKGSTFTVVLPASPDV